MDTLEQRITNAFSERIASSEIAKLIAETEEGITAAEAAAEQARLRALDPIASPDPVKARTGMEGAAFSRDRLRTILPRLHKLLKQVEHEEYVAQWEPEYERVKAVRDQLAAEMREVYPAAVARLADLFQRMAECDEECSRINGSAPSGDHRRLRGVELTARGVEALLQPDVWIAKELRLPSFPRDDGPIYAWPVTVSWSQAFARSMSANPNMMRGPSAAVTPEQIKERNEALQREGERVIAHYKERDRQREEREIAEARASNDREMERKRSQGWPI
jgi:hypothetical protein